MSLIRLVFALAACLLLSSCGLINTALRLVPLAMLLADEGGKGTNGQKSLEMRGKQVEDRGAHGILPTTRDISSEMAFKR